MSKKFFILIINHRHKPSDLICVRILDMLQARYSLSYNELGAWGFVITCIIYTYCFTKQV
jgi:hypothetical protein